MSQVFRMVDGTVVRPVRCDRCSETIVKLEFVRPDDSVETITGIAAAELWAIIENEWRGTRR